MKKTTIENIIERGNKIHNNKYSYTLITNGSYKTVDDKVDIICPEHGVFKQTISSHLNGRGCPKCGKISMAKKCKKPLKQLVEELTQIHSGEYSYHLITEDNYENNKSVVPIVCPIHGVFKQKIIKHLQGHKCPKCKGRYKTIEEIIEKAIQIHGNKYDYSKSIYKNGTTEMEIICPIHGSFYQTPKRHLNRKQGCPMCNQSHLEKNVMCILNKDKIPFIYQKQFEWLINPSTSYKLSLDFYLPYYNIAIECQGRQHFEAVDHFGGEEGLKIVQKRDIIKFNLCKEHNIKIFYIVEKEFINKEYFIELYNDINVVLNLANSEKRCNFTRTNEKTNLS